VGGRGWRVAAEIGLGERERERETRHRGRVLKKRFEKNHRRRRRC